MPGMTPRIKQYQVHTFQQSYEVLTAHVSNSVAPTYRGFTFLFSSLSDSYNWAQVFDQYRIDFVEVWYVPGVTDITGASNLGLLTTAVDYDDATAPASVAGMLNHEDSLTTRGIAGHYHKFKPHVAIATYSGAFSSYGNVQSPWIDVASPSVEHYGLKAAWTVCDASTYVYDMVVRLSVSVRACR